MADFDPSAYLAEKTAAQGANVPHGTTGSFDPETYLKEKGAALPKYETLPQEALTALEGAGRGATLGLSDELETGLGLSTPEDIQGRREANPIISGGSQVAGGAGLIGLTGGLAAPAEALVGGAGLASGALAGVGEGALMGVGNLVTDHALGDPNLNAQKIISEIGMGALLGGGLGAGGHYVGKGIESIFGKSGYPKGTVSEAIHDTGDELANGAKLSSSFEDGGMPDLMVSGGEKIGAQVFNPKVKEGADFIGARTHEGMLVDNEYVKKLTDALINTEPTYAGQKVRAVYDEGWNIAKNKMDQIAGSGQLSKRQLGDTLQNSFATQIQGEAEPFNALYQGIKNVTQDIPLSEKSIPDISKDILNIPEVKRSFKSPAAALARDVSEEISSLKTVDDLRAYQTELNSRLSPMSPPQEKRILGLVQEKLDGLERSTITKHAENFVSKADMANPEQASVASELSGLLNNIDAADAKYAPFRKDIGELSEWLGKGKVYGPKDAIDFVKNRLEPEDLVQKLTSTKYSKLFEFLDRKFPEQSAHIKQYIKDTLREKSIREGIFSPKDFVSKVDDLEPEIQKALFSKQELDTINATKDYLSGFPKNYNPSGTANKSALLAFGESPRKMAVANGRALWLNKQIKQIASLPGPLRPNPIMLGSQMGQRLSKLNAADALAQRAQQKITDGAQAIFGSGAIRGGVETGAISQYGKYEDHAQRIAELSHDPEIMGNHLTAQTIGLDKHLPNITQGIQNSMVASIQFLNSKLPRPKSQFPLSTPWQPSEAQKQQFEKYYSAVNEPISILSMVKKGTLTHEAMDAVASTHPDLLNEMRTQVMGQLNSESAKNMKYQVKMSLAKFLGRPLDSSMLPQVVMSNQMALNAPAGPHGMSPKQQRSTQSGLAKLKVSERAATNTQGDEQGDKT